MALVQDVLKKIMEVVPAVSRLTAALRIHYVEHMNFYDTCWRRLPIYTKTVNGKNTEVYYGNTLVYANRVCGDDIIRVDHKYNINMMYYTETDKRYDHYIIINLFSGKDYHVVRCKWRSENEYNLKGTPTFARENDPAFLFANCVFDFLDNSDNRKEMARYMIGCPESQHITTKEFDLMAAPPPFLRAIPVDIMHVAVENRRLFT